MDKISQKDEIKSLAKEGLLSSSEQTLGQKRSSLHLIKIENHACHARLHLNGQTIRPRFFEEKLSRERRSPSQPSQP